MKTLKSIKTVLVISALALLSSVSQSWAEGGVGTGGGNPIPARPNTQPYAFALKKIILESRPMVRAEFNRLRNWSTCNPADCDNDPFMIARQRLLTNEKETRKIIDTYSLTILEDKPCDVTEGTAVVHKAASAKRPNEICFSVSEISKYEVSVEAPNFTQKMIKGLFFHEIIHLLGGDESEARIMQERIAPMGNGEYDSVNAIYNIKRTTEVLNSTIKDLDQLLVAVKSNKVTDAAACARMVQLNATLVDKKVTLSEQEEWDYDRAIIRLNIASVGFCDPSQEFNDIFGKKLKISELDLHLPAALKQNDEIMKKIEVERAYRFSSATVYFSNLTDRSRKNLFLELQVVRADLVKSLEALKAMAKL